MGVIAAAMVRELRELTDTGMMDSRKALATVEGDTEKAIEFLRERGLASAQKEVSRIAAGGMVAVLVSEDDKKGAAVGVSTETDFVAKNERFKTYAGGTVQQTLNTDTTDFEGFLTGPWMADPFLMVEEELSSIISVTGERFDVRRFRRLKEGNGFVEPYVHADGKIGVPLTVKTDVMNDAIKEMAKNVTMQIAALKLLYMSDTKVDADHLEEEREILATQIKNDPKVASEPEKVIEDAVQSRLQKELKEICLLDQTYVEAEDGKQSVVSCAASVVRVNQMHVTIKAFVRYGIDEGPGHKSEDPTKEVARQVQG